jgi:hypothetical protein
MRVAADRSGYAPEADRAFHEALYRNLDNSVLLSLLDVFWLAVSKATERSNVVDPPTHGDGRVPPADPGGVARAESREDAHCL